MLDFFSPIFDLFVLVSGLSYSLKRPGPWPTLPQGPVTRPSVWWRLGPCPTLSNSCPPPITTCANRPCGLWEILQVADCWCTWGKLPSFCGLINTPIIIFQCFDCHSTNHFLANSMFRTNVYNDLFPLFSNKTFWHPLLITKIDTWFTVP